MENLVVSNYKQTNIKTLFLVVQIKHLKIPINYGHSWEGDGGVTKKKRNLRLIPGSENIMRCCDPDSIDCKPEYNNFVKNEKKSGFLIGKYPEWTETLYNLKETPKCSYTYTIRIGDTKRDIARNNFDSFHQLMKSNPFLLRDAKIGDNICIPVSYMPYKWNEKEKIQIEELKQNMNEDAHKK